ncbi:hypothetical protein YC2023_014088 [Brassica napus]
MVTTYDPWKHETIHMKRRCLTKVYVVLMLVSLFALKLSIKSLRIPELFIESTVMAAVTSLLSDGIHIGVLVQGKMDLSQRGVVVDRSFKHRSTNQSEHRRIKDLRGYFEDGCFNGVLAVTSAIENWELKIPFTGSSSPLISDPKIQQTILTEDDDFLISACDILSSWNAVSNITQRLRRGDP